MKKTIRLVGVGLLLVSMALAGCASMAPMQKTIVTKSNLSALKGTWSGWTTFSSLSTSVLTDLEIYNDTVPIQAKMILTGIPEGVAASWPVSLSTGNTATFETKNMRISDQGTLTATAGENFIEITYYAGEKPKLDGWFYYFGSRGTVNVTRK